MKSDLRYTNTKINAVLILTCLILLYICKNQYNDIAYLEFDNNALEFEIIEKDSIIKSLNLKKDTIYIKPIVKVNIKNKSFKKNKSKEVLIDSLSDIIILDTFQ